MSASVSSVSRLRRIATASPKKAVAAATVGLATAGMLFAAGPAAQAATPASATAAAPAAANGSAKAIAREMIKDDAQYAAFSKIVKHESGWDHTATNSSSGAYGLVQALPASKMASAGADWKTNPKTQIKWGLDYMNDRYGSPVKAWSFWQANGWY
ncbi:transglycosylase SLT domain-containing protein [Streptomyces sp. E11-3]|uniref:aggregation-promoting factor C-terminal-like domain-containing protein n=1 Tax=Streptomyces sp. E11-3 TaxID=3110112 RepID=UPI00397FF939